MSVSEDELRYAAINDLKNTIFRNSHIGILVIIEQQDIILRHCFSLQGLCWKESGVTQQNFTTSIMTSKTHAIRGRKLRFEFWDTEHDLKSMISEENEKKS